MYKLCNFILVLGFMSLLNYDGVSSMEFDCNAKDVSITVHSRMSTEGRNLFAEKSIQPGSLSVPRGEVFYLIQCVPVEKQVRESDSCFMDKYIVHNNMIIWDSWLHNIIKNVINSN